MAQNNVFQMLAQQEIDRPERDLKRLQLKKLMDEEKYQEKFRADMAAQPQSTTATRTLGSLAPQGAPFNPVADQPQASMDPNGGTLASLGVNPMQQTEQKPQTLLDGFQREYNFHTANGRPDLAKKVHQDQLKYTLEVAAAVEGMLKQPGGQERVIAWMKANPDLSSVLGDPSTIKIHQNGISYPVTKNDSNEIEPGIRWTYINGVAQTFPVKTEQLQTIAPGYGVLDGKGGVTVPVPKSPDYKTREYQKGDQTITEESQDGGATWKPLATAPRYKPASNGTDGGGDDVEAWAKAITEGRANLQDVPSRGTIRSQVVKLIEKQGGTDYAANKADNAAYSSSITQQQKAVGAMGSFVKNMDAQIAKVGELSAALHTFDSRILNVPLRAARAKIAGSALQSKYDMYLTEIESEIGKLATGSAGSVAELSVGAQEKWAKIHDKNLSIKDMLELLKETSHAGKLRMKSVKDQLEETRKEQRNRGKKPDAKSDPLGIL